MIPREILKQVRRVEIATRGLVNEVFSGEYHSVFKGRGMNFAEVRAYQYGDDIRSIDWNVTARTGTPFVKVFDEERELTVMLVVDVSASGEFGSRSRMKGEVAGRDLRGAGVLGDHEQRQGRAHHLQRPDREVRAAAQRTPARAAGAARAALLPTEGARDRHCRCTRGIWPGSCGGVRSSFLSQTSSPPGIRRPWRWPAGGTTRSSYGWGTRGNGELPAVGYIELEDAETGEQLTVNVSDPAFREAFDRDVSETRTALEREFRKTGVDVVEISTDRPYADRLMRFFRQRAKRFR